MCTRRTVGGTPCTAGQDAEDVALALADDGPPGPPPVDFSKSAATAAVEGGTAQVSDFELRKPGRYALVCFISDADGKGKPHLRRGTLEEVEVR